LADGVLSDAQLESVIYAGEAHSGHLAGAWTVDETWDLVSAAAEENDAATRFRRGWFLGDGTGAGKGRQVAGIILDNWLQRPPPFGLDLESDKLLEDAQRDWSALGMERLLVTPLSRFRRARRSRWRKASFSRPMPRCAPTSAARRFRASGRSSNGWAPTFDGVIIFDEATPCRMPQAARENAAMSPPRSRAARACALQHALPNARVVYVSATGATTVHNLAYAQRLGLWGGEDFPFRHAPSSSRRSRPAASRRWRCWPATCGARPLHRPLALLRRRRIRAGRAPLTPEQTRIYDAYAGAFAIIHNNLDAAMEAANITGDRHAEPAGQVRRALGLRERQAALLRPSAHQHEDADPDPAIERDLEAGHAAVIQIVSTGEALMERRLAEIPTEEWNDVRVDITPREYVLDYLAHSFPVQLYEPFTDSEGNLSSRPVFATASPSKAAKPSPPRRADRAARLAAARARRARPDRPALRHGCVAEVTGRSRRIVRKQGRRPPRRREPRRLANLAETQAFMDDRSAS
jgi:hypothetical protein